MFDGHIDYRKHYGVKPQKRTHTGEFDFYNQKTIEIQQYTTVGDNELLLGTEDNWRENPESELVTIPFDPKRRITVVISGDNDGGKTTLLNSIVYDQLFYRFNRLIAHIDPKGDTINIPYPNTVAEFVDILESHEIYPEGYAYKEIYPAAAGMLGVTGEAFTPALPNFRGADKATELDRLAEFFNLKDSDSSTALGLLGSIMLQGDPPNTPKELLDAIDEMKETGIGKRVDKLGDQIRMRVLKGELGDTAIDIPKLLHDFKILVLKVPLTEEAMTGIIASILISNIMASREKSLRIGQGWVNKPATLVLDEANKYAGSNTLTNRLITQVTTKFRAINNRAGLDSILAAQHISDLDHNQVLEADYIMGTRLTWERDIDLIKPRAGSVANIYTMRELEFEIGVHPKQFFCLDKNCGLRTFYPLPTRCAMKRVGS